jgi:protein-S-isoprenylcysteine O-methyltransferase Ste14
MAVGLDSNAQLRARSWWQHARNAYDRFAASERGYVWLDKLAPAYLFGIVTALKAVALGFMLQTVVGGEGGGQALLLCLHLAVSTAFFGLVTALYLVRRRPIRRVEGAAQRVAALLGSYVMLPATLSHVSADNLMVLFAADILMIVGTAGAAVALARLGRCFGIFPEARGLVTGGPYRLVRHPMYLFEFVAFLGLVLPATSPLSLPLYTVFVAMQLVRMHYEERILTTTFPEVYPAYCQRTARLIPGLY